MRRFDEQVVFHRLSRADVSRIARLMMDETSSRVEAKGYELRVSRAVMQAIIREGYSDEYGVRPLRQTIIRCAPFLPLSPCPSSSLGSRSLLPP